MNFGSAMFNSAEGEQKEPIDGRVESGEVPKWLSGSLIRNGPALFEVGDTSYTHFFDGLALLQKFSLESGSVRYSSQFVRSDTYEANMAKKRIVVGEFGTAAFDDPCKTLLGKFASFFYTSEEEEKMSRTDNTLVNVFPIGDQLFAATETPRMNRIDPETLDRVEGRDFGEIVAVNSVTAHPHFDQAAGDVYNLGSAFKDKSGPNYAIVRIPGGDIDKAEVVARIPSRWKWHPTYYHSFAITERYFILVESPLCLSIPRLIMAQKLKRTFDSAMRWYDGYDCVIHVVNRHDGTPVQKFNAPAFFTFHHMNAFEGEDGEIVMDVCAYESGQVVHTLTLKELRKLNQLPGQQLHLRRYRMRVGSDQPATFTTPSEQQLALEFPTINYNFNARKYRYGYGVGEWKAKPSVNSQILKVDWDTDDVLTWQEEGCEPSEAIFVERPDAKSEDDGVLLSSVIRFADQKRSIFLLILNAADMSEVARVAFDSVSVPRDIHGMFFGQQLLERLQVK